LSSLYRSGCETIAPVLICTDVRNGAKSDPTSLNRTSRLSLSCVPRPT